MKLKSFFLKNYWLLIGTVISFFLLVVCFGSLQKGDISMFFSSDSLYLPSVYQDIVVDGNSINGWTFNPAPNFFPDMLLFFVLMTITQNFIVAAFLFSIIQYFTIIFVFYAAFRTITNLEANIFALSLYLFSFILLFFLTTGSFPLAFIFISNSYHNGMFVMTLICLLLVMKFLKVGSWKYPIWIFALSALCYPCDKLFLISFIIPVILTGTALLFTSYDKKNAIKLIASSIAGLLVGVMLLNILEHNSVFTISRHHGSRKIEQIVYSWNIFYNHIRGYVTETSIRSLMVILSFVTYLWGTYYTLRTFIRIVRKEEGVTLFFIFQLFVFFYSPIVLFAPILNGYYRIDTIRYNYFPFILLPFNFILLLSPYLRKIKYSNFILNSICSVSMVIFLFWTVSQRDIKTGLKNYFNPYPDNAQILDALFEDDGVARYGITDDYWFAKQATMFSKQNIRIYSVLDNGVAGLHVSNKKWFTGGGKGRYGNPEFTFILWSSEKELPAFFKNENIPYNQRDRIGKYTLYEVQPFIYQENLHPTIIGK